jgi:aspartate kinase
VAFEPGCGVVSVVGNGLTTSAGALPRFLGMLAEAGATTRAVHAGPLRIAATIESAKLNDAQRALHAAFVGGE